MYCTRSIYVSSKELSEVLSRFDVVGYVKVDSDLYEVIYYIGD